MKLWYQSESADVLRAQDVAIADGLSENEAAQRLQTFGSNGLEASKGTNVFVLFISQFKDVLVLILLAAALVSWGVSVFASSSADVVYACEEDDSCSLVQKVCLDIPLSSDERASASTLSLSCAGVAEEAEIAHDGESEGAQEALLIFAIVLAIAIIGFFNEYKAEKTVEALKKLVGAKAQVKRGSQVVEVEASMIVPGDILVLSEGQKVPADARLLKVSSLQINEASLTGESLPVSKHEKMIVDEVSLGDQKNMVFAGTFVTQGTAEAVVVETGQRTELGKIAQLVNEVENEQTPMQRKLDDLGKRLGLIILAICAVVFIIVFLFVEDARHQTTLQQVIFAFTAAVALAVAAIPEGLAFVVRISLALGARRMAARNGLVRRLSAVEALGSTDVICSDKTGTLTRGEMTVRHIASIDSGLDVTGAGYDTSGDFQKSGKSTKLSKAHQELLLIGAICNNAHLKDGAILGDPTEGALVVSAAKNDMANEELANTYERIAEVPFTSDRKFMSTVHKDDTGYLLCSKGSLEATLERCSSIMNDDGKVRTLTTKDKDAIHKQNTALSQQALRVLAFASKRSKTKPASGEAAEKDLVFVGLQAMMDPPRKEVVSVIHQVRAGAGMRVVMITGDYIETAKAVAAEIGLQGEAMSGSELDMLSQQEFEERVEEIAVFARVNPEHKIRIVKALKKHGHQVAMTGDGVNDAPAIKAADIGIAMGVNGTDAAKEAADLILLDDKFVTIVNAIEEGRGIFDNVRKFVNFLISCNIAEVLVILFGILIFDSLLLTAAQLLFINIVTDGLPAVALGSDPARSDVLQAKPQRFQESILTRRVWAEIFIFGGLMTIAMLVQYWYNTSRVDTFAAVSAAFTAMVVYEMVRLVDIRTDYKIRWFSNPMLTVFMAISLALQFAVLYTPFLADYFGVGPLQPHDWLFMAVGSVVLFVLMKLINPLLDKVGVENHRHA